MRRDLLRALERRVVIVHMPPPAPSLRGLLVAADEHTIVLTRATHLDSKADLDGDQYIVRGPGVFVQALTQEHA